MKKLKFLVPMLLVAALVLVGASCSYSTSEEENVNEVAEVDLLPNTYSNADWGFAIDFPENWSRQFLTEDVGMISVGFAETLADETATPRSAVSVVSVTTDADSESFDAVTEELLAGFNADTNYNILESGETTLADQKAYRIVYTLTQNGEAMKYLHYWLVSGTVWHQVLYLAEPVDYDTDLSLEEDIIETFILL